MTKCQDAAAGLERMVRPSTRCDSTTLRQSYEIVSYRTHFIALCFSAIGDDFSCSGSENGTIVGFYAAVGIVIHTDGRRCTLEASGSLAVLD